MVQLIDSRIGPTRDDTMMMQWMLDTGIPFIVVATKVDKLKNSELDALLLDLKENYFVGVDVPVIPFSSVSHRGRQELWDAITAAAETTNQ